MTFRRAIAAIAVLVLAGCDSGKPTAQAASPAQAASSVPPSPVASQPATAAPSTTSGPVKLGTPRNVVANIGEATVTAFAYRQPTAKSAPKPDNPDMEWASVDAQVCVTKATGGTPYVNNSPWLLIYPDGTNAEPSSDGYNQFDMPGYPMGDRDVPAGRCVRGWITFLAPKGKRAVMVEYQRGDGTVLDWAAS